MSNKKGAEFAIGTIVMMVLGLVVLVILILVFRQQITKSSQGYTDLGQQALSGENCKTQTQSCMTLNECGDKKGRQITSVFGGWKDCKEGQICCKTS